VANILECRARSKLQAGQITEEEYALIVHQHLEMARRTDEDTASLDPMTAALLLLCGDALERGEGVCCSGRAALLSGSGGGSGPPIAGLLVLTDLRLLFMANGAATAAAVAGSPAVHLIADCKLIPQAESVPLHTLLQVQWTRFNGTSSTHLSSSNSNNNSDGNSNSNGNGNGDSSSASTGTKSNSGAAWTLSLSGKFGRLVRLQLPVSEPDDLAFAADLKTRLLALVREPSSFCFAPRAAAVSSAFSKTQQRQQAPPPQSTTAQGGAPSGSTAAGEPEASRRSSAAAAPTGALLSPADAAAFNAWRCYDPEAEYRRLGIDTSGDEVKSRSSSSESISTPAHGGDTAVAGPGGYVESLSTAWCLTQANMAYQLGATYPAWLCVPKACASEPLLQEAAKFRSKGRIPSLSWRCPWTGATISRCAQPLSGLRVTRAGRSRGDEALVRGLWRASALPLGRGDAPHLILDCRPRRNAQANAVAGKGFEDMVLYGRRRRNSYDEALRQRAEQLGLGNNRRRGSHMYGGDTGERTAITDADVYFDEIDALNHPDTLAAAAEASAREKLANGAISREEFETIVQGANALRLESVQSMAERKPAAAAATAAAAAAAAGAEALGLEGAAVARVADSPLPICELVFADIENIHVQRRAFRDVLLACNEGVHGGGGATEAWEAGGDNDGYQNGGSSSGGGGGGSGGGVGGSSSAGADLPAASAVWLKHVGSVLAAARSVVDAVRRRRKSVLVHCSDGWDRTPQVVSLACLLLDPYYRTIAGFGVLVEKEWLSFGHCFAERFGHGKHKLKYTQRLSPIFAQWLDCVWQVTEQLPHHFEFDGRLLLSLLDLASSCRFGNFLGDSEKERVDDHVWQTTESIWPYLEQRKRDYLNPLYRHSPPPAAGATVGGASGGGSAAGGGSGAEVFAQATLYPVVGPSRLRLWTALFQRWDAGSRPGVQLLPLPPSPPSPSRPLSPPLNRAERSDATNDASEALTSPSSFSSVSSSTSSPVSTTPAVVVPLIPKSAPESLLERVRELEQEVAYLRANPPSLTPTQPPSSSSTSGTAAPTAAAGAGAPEAWHEEGLEEMARRLCPEVIGSVHGYAWSTLPPQPITFGPAISEQPLSNECSDSASPAKGNNISGSSGGRTSSVGAASQSIASWVPDDLAHSCFHCNATFTVFLRRHHCRACGRCFCDNCAPLRRLPPSQVSETATGKERQCRDCFMQKLQEADASASEGGEATAGAAAAAEGKSLKRSSSLKTMKGWVPKGMRRAVKATVKGAESSLFGGSRGTDTSNEGGPGLSPSSFARADSKQRQRVLSTGTELSGGLQAVHELPPISSATSEDEASENGDASENELDEAGKKAERRRSDLRTVVISGEAGDFGDDSDADDDDDDEEGRRLDTEAGVQRRVLELEGLEDFVPVLRSFGAVTVADLYGAITDEDLRGDDIGMTNAEVSRFRAALDRGHDLYMMVEDRGESVASPVEPSELKGARRNIQNDN